MTAGSGPDGRGGPHAFVADIDAPALADDDHHHLSRALRLRPGDPLTVGDGAGRWRRCRFGSPIEPDGVVVTVPRRSPALTVAFALIKGDRPELVVQKLTELGIDNIVGFLGERSVVRWDQPKRDRHRQRWERVAREASMQSRRVWLPTIEPIVDFAQLRERPGLVLADPGAEELSDAVTAVAVGPEGGWSPAERAGMTCVGLGETVLRAETAALAAGVLVAANRRRQDR